MGRCSSSIEQTGGIVKGAEKSSGAVPFSLGGGSPFGLGPSVFNCRRITEREMDLRDGIVTIEDIVEDYRAMRKRVEGARSPVLMECKKTGELKTFPVRSRWNTQYNYSRAVKAKVLADLSGLRDLKMFVLTIDRGKAESAIPEWFVGSQREYFTAFGGEHVSTFLRKVRDHVAADRKKKGKVFRWNYVCWFMELHESGEVHFHVVFRGGWVAAFSDLERFWGLGAVRYKPFAGNKGMSGRALAGYLTGYLSKDLRRMMAADRERQAALLWFLRRRLFNIRHGIYVPGGKRLPAFQAEWVPYDGSGAYGEFMGYARSKGYMTMQAVESLVYGIKCRSAFHTVNSSQADMIDLRQKFDEALQSSQN